MKENNPYSRAYFKVTVLPNKNEWSLEYEGRVLLNQNDEKMYDFAVNARNVLRDLELEWPQHDNLFPPSIHGWTKMEVKSIGRDDYYCFYDRPDVDDHYAIAKASSGWLVFGERNTKLERIPTIESVIETLTTSIEERKLRDLLK